MLFYNEPNLIEKLFWKSMNKEGLKYTLPRARHDFSKAFIARVLSDHTITPNNEENVGKSKVALFLLETLQFSRLNKHNVNLIPIWAVI